GSGAQSFTVQPVALLNFQAGVLSPLGGVVQAAGALEAGRGPVPVLAPGRGHPLAVRPRPGRAALPVVQCIPEDQGQHQQPEHSLPPPKRGEGSVFWILDFGFWIYTPPQSKIRCLPALYRSRTESVAGALTVAGVTIRVSQ